MGFEVRVERTLLATQPRDEDDKYPYGLRVGWSTPDTSLLLGEDILPWNISWRNDLDKCSLFYSLAFFYFGFFFFVSYQVKMNFRLHMKGVV